MLEGRYRPAQFAQLLPRAEPYTRRLEVILLLFLVTYAIITSTYCIHVRTVHSDNVLCVPGLKHVLPHPSIVTMTTFFLINNFLETAFYCKRPPCFQEMCAADVNDQSPDDGVHVQYKQVGDFVNIVM